MYTYVYKHTHTHTYVYIYIYVYIIVCAVSYKYFTYTYTTVQNPFGDSDSVWINGQVEWEKEKPNMLGSSSNTPNKENNFSECLAPNSFELINLLKPREARFQLRFFQIRFFRNIIRQILKTWH